MLWIVLLAQAVEHDAGAYRVRADAKGVRLTVPDAGELRFGHAAVVAGGEAWPAKEVEPTRDGDLVTYDRGAWTEQYVLRSDVLQQMFVLRRVTREEVVIRVPARGARLKDARTVEFPGRLVYKDAIVLDRSGRTRDLSFGVEEDALLIRIPKDYLATAVFPVLIDPLVGSAVTLAPAGGLWRIPGVHLAWNSKDQYYLAVWHQDLVFNMAHKSHPSHNWLNESTVRARAIRVDAAGNVLLGDPVTGEKPHVGVTLGPNTATFAAFGPRVRYNAAANEFLVVWSEGQWFHDATFHDNTVYGDAVTDLNTDGDTEYAYCQEPYPSNSRVSGVRVTADPVTLAVSKIGGAVESSMAANGSASNPSGTDAKAIHPCILPDVSWDGLQYVVTWQTLEVPVIGRIQPQSFGQFRHVFRAQSRVRYRLMSAAGAPLATYTDLSDPKERFFVKGPTSKAVNIVDGSVPTNLMEELSYDSVPTDPSPHVDSIILPGADGLAGTADDIPVGSLLVWNVTSLTFNLGKSRVRGRFLPAGQQTASIVWDVFSSSDGAGSDLPSQFVQRAYVAAGAGDVAANSHFLVAFESVEDVVRVGTPRVEFVGSLKMRLVDATGGAPMGGVIDIATSDAPERRFYMNPTVSWSREKRQYFLAWAETDTLWNPITLGRAWDPGPQAFTDPQSQLFGSVSTAYPASAPASGLGDHDVMYAAQEDDFGANYLRRFKFASSGSGVPTPGGEPTLPSGNKDSEEGLFGGNCAFGSVRDAGFASWPLLALLLLAAFYRRR
ncbi:MAG TPA: hypothetical protein VF950_19910 [Planctomycetota bacterium]